MLPQKTALQEPQWTAVSPKFTETERKSSRMKKQPLPIETREIELLWYWEASTAKAGDRDSIPGPRGLHRPQGN